MCEYEVGNLVILLPTILVVDSFHNRTYQLKFIFGLSFKRAAYKVYEE